MLTYDNCPNKLPCMPDWPTINGNPFTESKPVFSVGVENPVGYYTSLSNLIEFANEFKDSYNDSIRRVYIHESLPVLGSIGLIDALFQVEEVLAWNQTEKHPGAKWKTKSIDYHDAKAVGHLSKAQMLERLDPETGVSHRAHAAARMLMSLAQELNAGK